MRNHSALIIWTKQGLYCPAGDFYIDPHRAVDTALITHAHADHARRGSRKYICTSSSVSLLQARLGKDIHVIGKPFRKQFQLRGVRVSFHPAGHILGSAQVRLEYQKKIWVVSGDYKREVDPSCERFEVVPCDTFITEATFGTPRYTWKKDCNYGEEIYQWWQKNARMGKNSLLFGYSLGKGQRILAELFQHASRPILIHSSMIELTQCYRDEGWKLAPTRPLEKAPTRTKMAGELILAPPSILQTQWASSFGKVQTAFASGWMHTSGRRAHDHGFVMSDHADWNDLNQTIDETKAKNIYVLHRDGALVRHLRKRGLNAHPISQLEKPDHESTEGTLPLFAWGGLVSPGAV